MAIVLAILASIASPASASARCGAPLSFTYDAPSVARVDVQPFTPAEARPTQLSGSRDESASPSVEARGTPTTSSGSVVATNTADDVLRFGSRSAAREGLTGDAGVAANRFFRDATSKSVDFQAQALPGGGYRLQFFSPANNPGYGKLYVQEIDAAGNVVREFKNTLGPDGLIDTKWVHGGP